MTARGMVVVSIDHPGIGDSDRPDDGFALTAELIARVDGNVTEWIHSKLCSGTLLPDLPALPGLISIGVGHSMGGLITVLQQAERQLYQAVVLLGFSDNGLVQYLPDAVKTLIGKPEEIKRQLPEIMRQIFLEPYPELPSSPQTKELFHGDRSDRAGAEGLKVARDKLLPSAGIRAMIPGGVKVEMASIFVPVFLGVGDRDMVGWPHGIPTSLPGCGDITLFVQPTAGHNHFIFASRFKLFERLAEWSRMLSAGR
jgi:pimeloyl-ACP methyl ester carboxylesterase